MASLVSTHANATLEERTKQVDNSPLRRHFEYAAVTDTDKDAILDELVEKLGVPRPQILIVDDRMVRGIAYGNRRGHPTVWFKNGKFAHELPNAETGQPAYTIRSLDELIGIV